MLYFRQVLTAVAALLVASTIAWADTYTIASFSGAINGGSANVKPPFSGNGFTQGDSISGSFVFDNQHSEPPALREPCRPKAAGGLELVGPPSDPPLILE